MSDRILRSTAARRKWAQSKPEEQSNTAKVLEADESVMTPTKRTAHLKTCISCGSDKHPVNFSKRLPTNRCQHGPRTCKTCVSTWIEYELERKNVDAISCPECHQILEYLDVTAFAKNPVGRRYAQLCINSNFSQTPGFRWCFNTDCTSGQVHGKSPLFECRACGHQHCIYCAMNWHEGLHCLEAKAATPAERMKQEAASETLKEKISKRCPNPDCNRPIQKESGCDNMICTCGTSFCWDCLARYPEGLTGEDFYASVRWHHPLCRTIMVHPPRPI